MTSDPVKSTLPGGKRWLRAIGHGGRFEMDILDLRDAPGEPFAAGQVAYDPANPQRNKVVPTVCRLVDCRSVVMEDGEMIHPHPSLEEMANYSASQLQNLPEGCLRLVNPHIYKVGISARLRNLRDQLTTEDHFGPERHATGQIETAAIADRPYIEGMR